MQNSTFQAAKRTPKLVNRIQELETIRNAIYHPEASCQLVLIRGEGGMGKSRLSEEILWRGGNLQTREQRGPVPTSQLDWDWSQQGRAIVGDLIDVSSTNLHARANFLHAIRDALVWDESGINFTKYDSLYEKFQDQRFYMGDHNYILNLEKKAEDQFLKDYKENVRDARITLILDTVEKLYPVGGTELLLEEGLLQAEDMSFYTYQWLLKQIREGGFPNTTLILVGRAGEGKDFFDAVEKAAGQNPDCKVTDLGIEAFSLEDTREYFHSLADEGWGEKNNNNSEAESSIVAALKDIATDEARIKTLFIYTGGQPVRLALYTVILIEGKTIPEPLLESPQQAEEVSKSNELEKVQRKIEAGFISLLFGRLNLRAEILKTLVRAPRGLDPEQLDYCLSSKPDETPQAWLERKRSDPQHQEIAKQIDDDFPTLRKLAIVKTRPDNRLGLQDEVYRIYARAMSGTEKGREVEKKARLKLHQKLQGWAYHQSEVRLLELTKNQTSDESKLRFDLPSRAMEIRFPSLSKQEERERARLRTEIQLWELEYLHYALLSNLTRNLNKVLFEMADRERMAADDTADALIQSELWQALRDPAYALEEFGNLEPWGRFITNQQILIAFQRFALQNDVTGWAIRLCVKNKYERAIQFTDQVEKTIEKWRKEKADGRFLITSWQHTLARSERTLWSNYARILSAKNVAESVVEMEKTVCDLERLAECGMNQIALVDRNENGFKGHPAEEKLQRTIALYHNYIGYGYATLGKSAKSVEAYVKSLRSMREVKLPHMEATTRNNLSRVLSDRGHVGVRNMCLDALNLRKKQGEEVPIGFSYNTLALIDNNHTRPDRAWVEASIAIAYFRKAEYARGLGLAYLQLSEALRRMARLRIEAHHLRGDTPEIVLETAEHAVNEAVDIFTTGEASGELMRRVEAWIEKGCLERDLINYAVDDKQKARHYRDALYYLAQADDLARERKYIQLQLNARVNIAWAHYHFREFAKADETLKIAENLLPPDCILTTEQIPASDRDDLYVFKQLSKIYGLRGRMAMEKFGNCVEEVKSKGLDKQERRIQIHDDPAAQQFLRDASDAYVLSLAYAQLLSPRSSSLTTIYDWLYEKIKEFNLSELKDFFNYVKESREKYKVKDIKVIDYGDLSRFLEHTFGDFDEGL